MSIDVEAVVTNAFRREIRLDPRLNLVAVAVCAGSGRDKVPRTLTDGTILRKMINVPARAATSARRPTLHLPKGWPWQQAWTQLFNAVSDPPLGAAA